MDKIKNIICPVCKLSKLEFLKPIKKGNITKAKCVICYKIIKIKDIRKGKS